MRLKRPNDFTGLGTLELLKNWLTQFAQEAQKAINGRLTLHENTDPSLVTAVFTAANTEQSFNHLLGQVPQGYIVVYKSASMTVYDGTTQPTADRIYLKSSALGTARVWVF